MGVGFLNPVRYTREACPRENGEREPRRARRSAVQVWGGSATAAIPLLNSSPHALNSVTGHACLGYNWQSVCNISEGSRKVNIAHDSYFADNLDNGLQDFKECGWEKIFDSLPRQDYSAVSERLYEASMKADDAGNQSHGRVLWLLGEACSMMLVPERFANPFDPIFVGGGKRSTIAEDFTESEIEYFAELIDTIDRPFLRARLADLVWDRKSPRDVRFALAAIDSYMQLPLDAHTWFSGKEQCWQRAIILCRMIGVKAGDRLKQIESNFLTVLKSASVGDGFFSLRIADTLRTRGLPEDEATAVAAKLESLAHEFDANADFHASGSMYNAAAKWFRYAGDDAKSTDMTVAEAEALEQEADARLSTDYPSHGVAASFLENAVQVYRGVPRSCRDRHQVDERIADLQSRISEYGKLALEEMAAVSRPTMDLIDMAEQARDAVSDKPVDEALRAFISLFSVDAEQLRRSAQREQARYPILALVSKVTRSHDGRVVSRTSGISPSNPSSSNEDEILAWMHRFHYEPLVVAAVRGLIMPALHVLRMEHRITEADFIELARQSPIVPSAREILFGKALSLGFTHDFWSSIHMLSPQIEHMVRFRLQYAGVITTHTDQQNIVTEIGLSSLIEIPEAKSIFGENMAYELKALFCNQLGPNLRNNVAHGLLDDHHSTSDYVVYAWWWALKLLLSPFWQAQAGNDTGESENETEQSAGVDSAS